MTSTTPFRIELGEIFEGKYRILRELGRGGFGMVYLAHQVNMDRHVALKVLKPSVGAEAPSAKERFLREVKIISKLRHPNTVTIHDYGESAEGIVYMVLEYVEGDSLKDVLKREGAQEPSVALSLARQIAKSLGEAHRLGVIHRDLKPANIMVTHLEGEPNFVKVLDFGVARLLGTHDGDLTRSGVEEGERALIGTPRYMSPEQVRGEELTPATDLYSLGLILYEMLIGEPAVQGDTTMGLITQQISSEPLRLPHLAILPPGAQQLIRHATDKNIQHRIRSAEQFAEETDHLLMHGSHERGIPGNPGYGPRATGRHGHVGAASGYQPYAAPSAHGAGLAPGPHEQYPSPYASHRHEAAPGWGEGPTALRGPQHVGLPGHQDHRHGLDFPHEDDYAPTTDHRALVPGKDFAPLGNGYPEEDMYAPSPVPVRATGRHDVPLRQPVPSASFDAPTRPQMPSGRFEAPQRPTQPSGRFEAPQRPPQPSGRFDAPPRQPTPSGRFDAPAFRGAFETGRYDQVEAVPAHAAPTPAHLHDHGPNYRRPNELGIDSAELPPVPLQVADSREMQLAAAQFEGAAPPVRSAASRKAEGADPALLTTDLIKLCIYAFAAAGTLYILFLTGGPALGQFLRGSSKLMATLLLVAAVPTLVFLGESVQRERFQVVQRPLHRMHRFALGAAMLGVALVLLVILASASTIVYELRTTPNWFLDQGEPVDVNREPAAARLNRDLSYSLADGIELAASAAGVHKPTTMVVAPERARPNPDAVPVAPPPTRTPLPTRTPAPTRPGGGSMPAPTRPTPTAGELTKPDPARGVPASDDAPVEDKAAESARPKGDYVRW